MDRLRNSDTMFILTMFVSKESAEVAKIQALYLLNNAVIII